MENKDVCHEKEIWVTQFTEESAQIFRNQVMLLSELDPNMVITIYIDSYGGSADALAKMLATMDEVPNRFVTATMGKAMSCGAILLSHGDIRFVDKYSTVMIHNVSSGVHGDIHHIKATSNECERINNMFMGLLAKNCGKSYDELQDIIKKTVDSRELYLSPEDCLEIGICDKIGAPKVFPLIQWIIDVAPEKESMNDLISKAVIEVNQEFMDKPTKKKPSKKKPTKNKSTK